MNCLDFRREILAQPLQVGDEARRHSLECAACAGFLERQRELDHQLYEAMRVPVPDGLAERVLLARGRPPRARRGLWALAATVLLAAGLGYAVVPTVASYRLGREAIAHVREEPRSFKLVSSYAPDLLPSQLADQGMKLVSALGAVTYSVLCPLEGQKAHHVVVRTAQGPVTLLLMPDDSGPRRRVETRTDGMTAIMLPAARGSIAIVASDRGIALAAERMIARA